MPRKPRQDSRSVYDKALGLLARREHSARELKVKLAQRGHAADEAVAAIDRLKVGQYQSDDRFAGSLARRRAAQGYGPRRIEAELKSHNLPDAAIRSVIAELEINWQFSAAAQLRRHYAGKVSTDRADRAKRAGFLLRRGFDAATVRIVTHAAVDDPDEEIG